MFHPSGFLRCNTLIIQYDATAMASAVRTSRESNSVARKHLSRLLADPELAETARRKLKEHSVEDANGCWVWGKGLGCSGHAMVCFAKGRNYGHRVAWVLANGRLPDVGKVVMHKCPGRHNAACVNPAHLELGSQKENVLNGYLQGSREGRVHIPDAVVEFLVPRTSYTELKRVAARLGCSRHSLSVKVAKRRADIGEPTAWVRGSRLSFTDKVDILWFLKRNRKLSGEHPVSLCAEVFKLPRRVVNHLSYKHLLKRVPLAT